MIPRTLLSLPVALSFSAVCSAGDPPVQRVGGDDEAAELVVKQGAEGPLYSAGDVFTDTKLPVGYPPPTPPGAIEIKQYPQVRRAEVSGTGDMRGASQRGFFPLFRHISRHGIAMTAPVEMEYAPENGSEPDSWTMAFLYHEESDGDTGVDAGNVRIVDAPGVMVLSLGVQGVANLSDPKERSQLLQDWLESNEEWRVVEDAPVRVLGYNGPYVPPRNRWWEVQMVIEATDVGDSDTE